MKFPKIFNELPEYFSHIRQSGSNYAPALDTVVADADGFNDDLITPQAMIEVSKSQRLSKLAAQRNYAHGNSMSQPYAWTHLLHDPNLKEQGIDANGVYYASGNMFGSPKGISGKLPEVSAASKYNRAGYGKKIQEGSIHELGFFSEHICDDYLFDPINREYEKRRIHEELTRLASEIEENISLQDLNNGAGVHYFCGEASSNATMTNRIGNVCELTYMDLLKNRQTLIDNRVPKTHTMHTGYQNTKPYAETGFWTVYCQPEIKQTLMTITDLFNRPAFIPVEQYAAGVNIIEGEIGRILDFRFVEVQDMLRCDNAGDYIPKAVPVSDTEGQGRCLPAEQEDGVNNTYINNGSRYTVFSLLIVGDDSFVNLQSYKSSCRISHCIAADDPFGNHLISSIWWKYGILITHPERLICIHTLARQ